MLKYIFAIIIGLILFSCTDDTILLKQENKAKEMCLKDSCDKKPQQVTLSENHLANAIEAPLVNIQGYLLKIEVQQVELSDSLLVETIFKLTERHQDCFYRQKYYVLDFFQSSLYENNYFLTIDAFVYDDASHIPPITYYLSINEVVFFISSKIPDNMIKTLSGKKEFVVDFEPFIGGDYLFAISKLGKHPRILIESSCHE